MEIVKIDGCFALLKMQPDTLLMLARACEWACEAWSEDGADTNPLANPTTEYTYRMLACCFEALALATDATGRMKPSDAATFTRNHIARTWCVMPGILGGAK